MASENPILNDPYQEPSRWFFTTPEGRLDQNRIMEGRRPFVPASSPLPAKAGPQGEMLGVEDVADHESLLVNRLRQEVGIWRRDGYPGATRITSELFRFWFENPNRQAHMRLFFAQR